MRLFLLRQDLQSLKFALDDFDAARARLGKRDDEAFNQLFHHAKVFVCAMRRFARLLHAAHRARNEYPVNVAQALDLQWKSNRAFFDGYTRPRNAIEHIDGEITGANHRFLNITNDYLEVVTGVGASVSGNAWNAAYGVWRAIILQVALAVDARKQGGAIASLLRVLARRIETRPT